MELLVYKANYFTPHFSLDKIFRFHLIHMKFYNLHYTSALVYNDKVHWPTCIFLLHCQLFMGFFLAHQINIKVILSCFLIRYRMDVASKIVLQNATLEEKLSIITCRWEMSIFPYLARLYRCSTCGVLSCGRKVF